jgi:hypothetical protein
MTLALSRDATPRSSVKFPASVGTATGGSPVDERAVADAEVVGPGYGWVTRAPAALTGVAR